MGVRIGHRVAWQGPLQTILLCGARGGGSEVRSYAISSGAVTGTNGETRTSLLPQLLPLLLVLQFGPGALATGCAKAPPETNRPADGGGTAEGPLPAGPPSVWTNGTAAELFAVDQVPRFEFTVPADQWAWLQANAKKEEYVAAQATYQGQPAGLIGLRFKGSFGTLINCFDAANKLTCAKLSFKASFEEYDPSNRFFGLKKVNLHSMIHDDTRMHERLAYDLYRASGVIAPRSTWANVSVNGKSYGLFSLVEEVDGRFTNDRWPQGGDGNLYKEAWPTSSTPASYTSKLETNKTSASHTAIATFAGELAAATGAGLGTTLGKWMDLPTLYRYLAVDDAIVNCDGITAFYSPGQTGPAWGNHNYFLYQEQVRDFFWLVPWDMDATLSGCSPFAAVPHWTTVPANCNQNHAVWGGSFVKAPGCDRVFQALAQDPAAYRAAVAELLAGPFAEATMLENIERWSAFIRSSVQADPTAAGEGAWMNSVQQLRATIPVLRQRVAAAAAGAFLVP